MRFHFQPLLDDIERGGKAQRRTAVTEQRRCLQRRRCLQLQGRSEKETMTLAVDGPRRRRRCCFGSCRDGGDGKTERPTQLEECTAVAVVMGSGRL
ncbi:hypothetical protein PIB30_063207, partial [Stylosanthes scabra]|nr:hypothetical protein [Stylosanthes scabra]